MSSNFPLGRRSIASPPPLIGRVAINSPKGEKVLLTTLKGIFEMAVLGSLGRTKMVECSWFFSAVFDGLRLPGTGLKALGDCLGG